MDAEMKRKLSLKVFKCNLRISYLQIMIFENSLDLYSKYSNEYKEDTIALKEELKNNTILCTKYFEDGKA